MISFDDFITSFDDFVTISSDWYSIGIRLVSHWYSIGIGLVFDSMVFDWYSIGIELVFDWYSIGIGLVLALPAPDPPKRCKYTRICNPTSTPIGSCYDVYTTVTTVALAKSVALSLRPCSAIGLTRHTGLTPP